ncbi:MAG: PorV/PorQ family protein [Candidatus Latescibacterota bacterium]|nr:MAG: PorV/PorQ family protein [Candidatus Latescibacterota bacterium]
MTSQRVLFLGILVTAPLLFAPRALAGDYYGTESPFVVGAGARASAMGVASTALFSDASVLAYNPAGLSFLERDEFVFYRTVLFDSQSLYHALSYAHPLVDFGTIGLSLLRLDVGGIEQRDGNNELLSSDLKNAQTRLLFGYATTLTQRLSAGFNLKVDHQSFAGKSDTGVGLDLGVTSTQRVPGNSIVKAFNGGLVIQNVLEPKIKLQDVEVADPMRIALGVSMLTVLRNVYLVTSVDFEHPRFSPFQVRVGQEVSYLNRYSIRGGMDHETPTMGFGARWKGISFDYAYRSQDLDQNHRFSLAVRFGASVSDRKLATRTTLEREVDTTINSRMADFEQRQIARAIHEADSLFAAEQYDPALHRYEAALLWDPENEHAKLYSIKSRYWKVMRNGGEAFEKSDYVQALLYYRRALDYIPADSAAVAMVERCNQKISASQRAAEITRQLLRQAIDLYDNRQYLEALAGFEEALNIDPTNEFALEFRVRCVANIDKLVKEHKRRAERLTNQGDYGAAIGELENALSYRPNDATILSQLETIRSEREEHEREMEVLRQQQAQVVETSPEPEPVLSLEDQKELDRKYSEAMKSFKAGDFDDAIQGFQQVWTVNSEFHNVSEYLTKAYLFKGMRLYSREQYADAARLWRQALGIDPDNEKVKRYLAKISEELRKVPGVVGDQD